MKFLALWEGVNLNKIKKIDPRIKLILLPIIAFMSFFVRETYLLLPFVLFAVFLFLISAMYRRAVMSLSIFGLIIGAEKVINMMDNPNIIFIYFMVMFFISRMFVIFLYGTYITRTTKISEMVAALDSMKIPKGIAISFSVLLRFAPTMRLEMRALKENMKIRGVINTKYFILIHPIKYLEYSLVPLLMRTVKIADELAASALIRGLDVSIERISLIDLRFTLLDGFVSLIALVIIVGVTLAQYIF